MAATSIDPISGRTLFWDGEVWRYDDTGEEYGDQNFIMVGIPEEDLLEQEDFDMLDLTQEEDK